jgi:hypothetical protein
MNDSESLPFPHPRHCPTVAEISFSKKLTQDLDREIAEIEEEISDIQKRLQLLQGRIKPLQRKRDNHASYISPFRRLPTEIIRIIVHMCLGGGVKLGVMTQICGTIRDIVTGMSDIWSRITLDPESWDEYDRMVCFSLKIAICNLRILGPYQMLKCGAAQPFSHSNRWSRARSHHRV